MQVRNLSFRFGDKLIFSGVDMDFPMGTVTGIVGKNGVGKTTFFRTLKGLNKSDSGSITMKEMELSGNSIGFLPTQPYFYPYMKAKEYLELVLAEKDGFQDLAELFELPLDELVQNYSTGMQKKLAFAGILGLEKRIQILDEPFNGVDLQSNVTISRMLTLEKESKVILVSSHMLDSMLTLCDRIYYIEEGFQHTLYNKSEYSQLQAHIEQTIDEQLAIYLGKH